MSTTTKHGRFYSAWCAYFRALLEEKALNPTDFAKLTGDRQNNIHQYLVGGIKPPLDKLDAWAKRLRLSDPEREKWTRLANLAHTPASVRKELEALQKRVEQLSRRADDL